MMRILFLFCFFSFCANAQNNEELNQRLFHLSNQLRCLVCQNQSIADSDADLAKDLKNEIQILLANGKTDDEILNFMTERYGDFVLYNPPLKNQTFLLWAAPFLLLIIGAFSFFLYIQKREKTFKENKENLHNEDLKHAQHLLEQNNE